MWQGGWLSGLGQAGSQTRPGLLQAASCTTCALAAHPCCCPCPCPPRDPCCSRGPAAARAQQAALRQAGGGAHRGQGGRGLPHLLLPHLLIRWAGGLAAWVGWWVGGWWWKPIDCPLCCNPLCLVPYAVCCADPRCPALCAAPCAALQTRGTAASSSWWSGAARTLMASSSMMRVSGGM